MKRFFVLTALCLSFALSANAQYRGRYNRVAPGRQTMGYRSNVGRPYVGLRIGPTFSTIPGDGGKHEIRTGVNVGINAGFPLSVYAPIYLETGLYYTEKGGKSNHTSAKLNYLELPLVFKYKAYVGNGFSIQPYAGGYVALGVGGKIKDNADLVAYSSFGDKDNQFRRGDAGIKLGCGVGVGMFYADVNYDWGLANITHNTFYDARTSAVTLNFGINF